MLNPLFRVLELVLWKYGHAFTSSQTFVFLSSPLRLGARNAGAFVPPSSSLPLPQSPVPSRRRRSTQDEEEMRDREILLHQNLFRAISKKGQGAVSIHLSVRTVLGEIGVFSLQHGFGGFEQTKFAARVQLQYNLYFCHNLTRSDFFFVISSSICFFTKCISDFACKTS